MSNNAIARPYAQALFELATEQSAVEAWSGALEMLAKVASDANFKKLVSDPRVSDQQLLTLTAEVCGEALDDHANNLVSVLIENQRMSALVDIASGFEALRAQSEGMIEAELICAQAVDDARRDKIAAALTKRLGSKVKLTVSEDASLLAGAIIRAGDWVIDGSALNRLNRLAGALTR